MRLTDELWQSFLDYNKDVRISNSKAGCMLVVVLMPAGISLDYFVYPKSLGLFLLLRIICSLLALMLWWLLTTPFGRRYFRTLGMLWFILPSLFISLMIYFNQGVESSYYAGLNLVLIAISWVAQVDVLETSIAVTLTLLMYCAACFFHGAVSFSIFFNNLYFILLTGIIVITGSYYVNRLRFREFALRTEVDQNRKELEASNLKLVELDKAKSEFFANISHELRTPLTLLIGPLERMRVDFVRISSEQRMELTEIMYNNAMRLLRLINDLLSLVQLDSRTLILRKEKLPLKAFIEGLAQSVSPMALQCHLEFNSRILLPEDLVAYIDRDKVEKIIYNLLFNSFKFTPPKGKVDLFVELAGDMLEIVVKDTGVGISSANLEKIFDRFWQAEQSTTRRYQGVGIGLALVKELATIHRGTVSAQSELGQGTTMRVKIDVSAPEASELNHERVQSPTNEQNAVWLNRLYRRAELFPAHVAGGAEVTHAQAPSDASLPQVLIIDDEPDMRRFLHSQLKEIYHVHEASNGAEAIALAKAKKFSLILLDFMMPDMDGLEVMRHLRELKNTQTTPIIVLTARADEDFKIKTLRAGATDFLSKPFSSTELLVRAGNMISVQQLQQLLVKKTEELEQALEQIKETESQMVHQAKMASLGQLSAGLMHEINNPLNFANTAFHLLKKRLASSPTVDKESLQKPLADIQDGIKRVVDITSGLRAFAHPDAESLTQVDLAEAVASAVRFVQLDPQQIVLKIKVPKPTFVHGNTNQLVHLFINLLQNSIDSLVEKNAVMKEIRIETTTKNEQVEMIFYDNGKGIAEKDISCIYDAFFTTKKIGSGVGLGLNICYRIIEQHKGKISVESQENEYCMFKLILPQTKS